LKNTGLISFPVAALSLALLLPGLTYAQSTVNSQSADDSANQSDAVAAQQAAQMVPVRAYLKNKLDAKHAQPGTTFTATLSESVQLKNGPQLTRGTQLAGTVTTNDKQADGTSRLALNITEAHLKNGETIPVKATIVGVWGPEEETAQGYNVAPGEQEANDWTRPFLTIDEVNATSGADLHSAIASQNSGVLVTRKKNSDVKLAAGSELALAIAKQDNVQQPAAESGN
jgi:hypothetical protein